MSEAAMPMPSTALESATADAAALWRPVLVYSGT
jgi:hypothetical protein